MVALTSRQKFQTRTRKSRSAPAFKSLIKIEFSAFDPFLLPDEFPTICKKTQYIICIVNDRLLYKQRMCTFFRVSSMWDYVENIYLSKVLLE